MLSMNPYASVIIVNYNGEPFLRKLLESLNKQTFSDFELIFVDNASTDNTVKALYEFIREKSFQSMRINVILNSKNLGFCKGNNIGLKYASGKYIVFLNNDTYVSPEWLEELVKVLDMYPYVGACQSKIMYAETNMVQTVGNLVDKFLSRGACPELYEQLKDMKKGILIDTFFYPSAASVIYRKSILEKIGGFDEELFYGDLDLGWRVRLLGYRIATNLNSICYHYGSQATKKLWSRGTDYHDYKERIYVMAKNYSFPTFLKRIFPSLALFFFESLYSSIKLKKPHPLMLIKAIFWNLRNLKNLLNKRRNVQRNRVVSDNEIEKHMVSYPFFIYGFRKKLYTKLLRRVKEA